MHTRNDSQRYHLVGKSFGPLCPEHIGGRLEQVDFDGFEDKISAEVAEVGVRLVGRMASDAKKSFTVKIIIIEANRGDEVIS